MNSVAPSRTPWALLVIASVMLMLTMGVRQTTGLFVKPIASSTGISIASISFALAIGQLIWGAVQPLFGAIADRRGPARVLIFGGLLMAGGCALTPFMTSRWGLMLSLGVMAAAGAGAGSFSVLIGATSQHIAAEKRSFAAGLINAGGSLGQFIFAPLVTLGISVAGWVTAMFGMAVASLLTLPLIAPLVKPHQGNPAAGIAPAAEVLPVSLGEQLRIALRDRSYWLLHLGFFTCGLHIAFLVTHLPGEIALCGLSPSVAGNSIALIGLFNVAGSLMAGALGRHMPMRYILATMYASRALLIALYLIAPPTPMTFYLFAAALGFTWLATVPPTAGIIGKRFGSRYLGTLFGLTLLSHQVGGFFGAWLGGVALERSGSYAWMWYADMALALIAALANLPISEQASQAKPAWT